VLPPPSVPPVPVPPELLLLQPMLPPASSNAPARLVVRNLKFLFMMI
jgi:hypothetical protein